MNNTENHFDVRKREMFFSKESHPRRYQRALSCRMAVFTVTWTVKTLSFVIDGDHA